MHTIFLGRIALGLSLVFVLGACTVGASNETPSSEVETMSVPKKPVPFGPFHFQDMEGRYASLFSGTLLWVGNIDKETIYAQAHARGYKILGQFGDWNTCQYMPDGPDRFQTQRFIDDVLLHRDFIVENYRNGTLLGLMELEEPDDPNCEIWGRPRGQRTWKVNPEDLYAAARGIRQGLGLPPEFPIGYITANPNYENYLLGKVPADGTINLFFSQYRPQYGDIATWIRAERAAAEAIGARIVWSVTGDEQADLLTPLLLECQQPDSIIVTYWKWGIEQVPVDSLSSVRDACDSTQGAITR